MEMSWKQTNVLLLCHEQISCQYRHCGHIIILNMAPWHLHRARPAALVLQPLQLGLRPSTLGGWNLNWKAIIFQWILMTLDCGWWIRIKIVDLNIETVISQCCCVCVVHKIYVAICKDLGSPVVQNSSFWNPNTSHFTLHITTFEILSVFFFIFRFSDWMDWPKSLKGDHDRGIIASENALKHSDWC